MAEKSPRGRGGFTKVHDGLPSLLHEKGCSGNEWAVLMELMRYQQPDGTFWRPRREIAQALGGAKGPFSESYVSNIVRSMTRKGIIHKVSGGGGNKAAVYELCE